MANYSQELAQDEVCQSHTGHMTGLWFLPSPTEWRMLYKEKEYPFIIRSIRNTELYRVERGKDFIVKPHGTFTYLSPLTG